MRLKPMLLCVLSTAICFATGLGDSITTGHVMKEGDWLEAADQTAWLILQGDGNLVLYKGKPQNMNAAIDGTGAKPGEGPYTLALDPSGSLVLKGKSKVVWTSQTNYNEGKDHHLRVVDSKAILYQGTRNAPGRAVWQLRPGTNGGERIPHYWQVEIRTPDGIIRSGFRTGARYYSAAAAASSSEANFALSNVKNGGHLNAKAYAHSPSNQR